MKPLILASASPRRRELLAQIGLSFTVQPASGEEIIKSTIPSEVVQELSCQKAREVAALQTDDVLVLGSDTVVALENEIMGKPKDEADAFRMLQALQGKTHTVYTGVTLLETGGEKRTRTFAASTAVTMYPMSEEEIRAYIQNGEPMDKAGAYAIQGRCAAFIKGISGDYNTVVGLPVSRIYQELKSFS